MSKRKSHLLLSLAVLAAIPLYSTYASADDDHDGAYRSRSDDDDGGFIRRIRVLEGKFGWTTQQVCMRTLPNPPGTEQVDPNTLKLLVPAEIVSMSGVGTATFKADGTMAIDPGSTADALQYRLINPGDTPLTSGLAPVCSGTWSIGAQNRAKVDWNCTIQTPAPGLTISAEPVNWDGWVADDGRTIDLNLK